MNNIHSDVFVGVLSKAYRVEKGFKGLLQLPDKQQVGVKIDYDGQLKNNLTENVGKTVLLVGDLAFPKDTIPVLTVRERLNGGGLVVKRGRLTKDPELKYSTEGKAYTIFSIAVNRGFGDRKKTYYVNCTIFGNDKEKNPAITLAEKTKKGQEIIVKGRLSTNKGNEKTFYNIIVSEYELIFSQSSQKNDNDDPYAEYADLGTVVSLDDIEITDTEEVPF